MDQFNIDITCHDFKVQPIAIHDDFAVFVGVRPLFFHFVVLQVEGTSNFRHFGTYQFHLHKFDVANEILNLKNQVEKNGNTWRISNEDCNILEFSLDPEMSYWIYLAFLGFELKIEPETGKWFIDILEKEIKRLESSKRYLSSAKKQAELLKKLQLPENGVYDFTSIVWICIQFEMNLLARHKYKMIGIAYLYTNLLKGKYKLSQNELTQIADVLENFDPQCTCDFCAEKAEMFDKAQSIYFPQKFYTRGEQKADSKHIRKCARLMFDKLSPVDKISLLFLLYYSPSVLVTLSYFSGLMTEQDLINLVCGDLQPDSLAEQETRQQISLVSWFRKIATT